MEVPSPRLVNVQLCVHPWLHVLALTTCPPSLTLTEATQVCRRKSAEERETAKAMFKKAVGKARPGSSVYSPFLSSCSSAYHGKQSICRHTEVNARS